MATERLPTRHPLLRFTFPWGCPQGPCKNIFLNAHTMFSEVILHLFLKHQNKAAAGLDQAASRLTGGFPWVTAASAAVAFLLPLDEEGHRMHMSWLDISQNPTLSWFFFFFLVGWYLEFSCAQCSFPSLLPFLLGWGLPRCLRDALSPRRDLPDQQSPGGTCDPAPRVQVGNVPEDANSRSGGTFWSTPALGPSPM